MRRVRRYWSSEEDAIIKDRYPTTQTPVMLTLLPNRNAADITEMAKRLNVGKAEGYRKFYPLSEKDFTPEEDALIKAHYPTMDSCKLLGMLNNKTLRRLTHRAGHLGIKKEDSARIVHGKGQPKTIVHPSALFTSEEDQKLIKLYPVSQTWELEKVFKGRTKVQICHRALHLGARKVTSFKQQRDPSREYIKQPKKLTKTEIKEGKKFANRVQDLSRPVNIPDGKNTIVYARPGQTEQEVIDKYFARRAASLASYMKQDSIFQNGI